MKNLHVKKRIFKVCPETKTLMGGAVFTVCFTELFFSAFARTHARFFCARALRSTGPCRDSVAANTHAHSSMDLCLCAFRPDQVMIAHTHAHLDPSRLRCRALSDQKNLLNQPQTDVIQGPRSSSLLRKHVLSPCPCA